MTKSIVSFINFPSFNSRRLNTQFLWNIINFRTDSSKTAKQNPPSPIRKKCVHGTWFVPKKQTQKPMSENLSTIINAIIWSYKIRIRRTKEPSTFLRRRLETKNNRCKKETWSIFATESGYVYLPFSTDRKVRNILYPFTPNYINERVIANLKKDL